MRARRPLQERAVTIVVDALNRRQGRDAAKYGIADLIMSGNTARTAHTSVPIFCFSPLIYLYSSSSSSSTECAVIYVPLIGCLRYRNRCFTLPPREGLWSSSIQCSGTLLTAVPSCGSLSSHSEGSWSPRGHSPHSTLQLSKPEKGFYPLQTSIQVGCSRGGLTSDVISSDSSPLPESPLTQRDFTGVWGQWCLRNSCCILALVSVFDG